MNCLIVGAGAGPLHAAMTALMEPDESFSDLLQTRGRPLSRFIGNCYSQPRQGLFLSYQESST